jgi:predicted transposase YbfD/YdcC
MDMSAEKFYRSIRGHWPVENKLHWSLDVIFREEAAGVGRDHAPENLYILRKTALSLLQMASTPRPAGKKR